MTASTGYGLPYPHSDLPAEKRLALYLAELDAAAARSKAAREERAGTTPLVAPVAERWAA